MSLIADSLKKALEEKSPGKKSGLEFNLISDSEEDKGGSDKKAELKRAFLLIGLPGLILAGMISGGVFDSQGSKVGEWSIWETLGLKSKAPKVRLSKVIRQPNAPVRPPTPPPAPKAQPVAPPPAPRVEPARSAPPVAPPAPAPVKTPAVVASNSMEAPASTEDIQVAKVVPLETTNRERQLPRTVAKRIVEKPKVKKIAPPKSLFQSDVSLSSERKGTFESIPNSSGTRKTIFNNNGSDAWLEKASADSAPESRFQNPPKSSGSLSMGANVPASREGADRGSRFSEPENSPLRSEKAEQGQGDVVPSIFKNSSFYFNRAIFYQQSKEWEKALENYRKASEMNPDNPNIYNNMGVMFKELGQYDLAINEFLQAVYLDPGYGKVYNNLGVVYFLKMNYAGAVRNYKKAIEIDPKNMGAMNNLATSYKAQSEFGKAREVLNQALKINPDHPGTNYNLAVLYETERNFEPAKHYYWRFIEVGENDHPSLAQQVKLHLESLK